MLINGKKSPLLCPLSAFPSLHFPLIVMKHFHRWWKPTAEKKKSHRDKAWDQICVFIIMSRSASNGTPAEKQKCWLLSEDDKQKKQTWCCGGRGVVTCRKMNGSQFEQQALRSTWKWEGGQWAWENHERSKWHFSATITNYNLIWKYNI